MTKLLIASTAALLLSGSLANAGMLLYSDENDRKRVVNTWIDQSPEHRAWYGAQITTGTSLGVGVVNEPTVARRVSPGFLLHSDENGNKWVENQYAR